MASGTQSRYQIAQRVFRTWTSDHVLTRKTKALWKTLNCFTIRRCLLLGDTFGSCHSPGPRPHSPFSPRRECCLAPGRRKVSLSPGPHFIQWVCIDELIPKRNIRPSDRGPASTTTEPELSARCPPAKLAPGSQRASFPALGRGWCAQPDKASPPVPACGGTSCLPARGAFPLPPPKSRRCIGFCRTLSSPGPCQKTVVEMELGSRDFQLSG